MRFHAPGEVVERTGLSIDTLRYYERIGLLGPVERTAGGRRRFSEAQVGWLQVLRCLRETGMSIADIADFARLARRGSDSTSECIAVLESHDARVEEQIAQLRERRSQLRKKIDYYRAGAPVEPAVSR